MAYVTAQPCVDVKDRARVEECPVEVIYYEDDPPDQWIVLIDDNTRFFIEMLPGRDGPLGSPGGTAKLGPAPVDAPHVRSSPLLPSGKAANAPA